MLYDLLLKELALEEKSVFNEYKIDENILTIFKAKSSISDALEVQELVNIKFIMSKYRDLFTSRFEKELIVIEVVKGI